MNRKLIIALIILALGSATLLGVFSLGLIDHSQAHSCPIAVMSGGDCPPAGDEAALVGHHISGIGVLTLAIPNGETVLQISVLTFSILILVLIGFRGEYNGVQEIASIGGRKKYDFWKIKPNSQKENILYWIGLHNKKELPALKWAYAVGTRI
ncbi:MAG: hypothetical protein ABH833_03235 [Parcubacteria group bacterium]